MVKNEDITLKYIEELEDPRLLFQQVMFYADSTNKNPWACMGYVFNQNNHTIVICEDKKVIGYISTTVLEDGKLFIHHASCKYGVVDKPKLLDDMIKMIGKKLNHEFPIAIMESDRAQRAWEKWGFSPSKTVLYEREVK